MTLLQQRDATRRARRLELYEATRQSLREILQGLIPGEQVVLFGSITSRGIFNDASDVDVALHQEPRTMSASQLMIALGEQLNRRVDVVLLANSRLREKILREGETWTL